MPGGSADTQIGGYMDPLCFGSDVLVLHRPDGVTVAFAAVCNHACCVPVYSGGTIACPCHGATWDLDGAIIAPSLATAPLPRLQVCVDAGGVSISY